jgi:hypothetical protein
MSVPDEGYCRNVLAKFDIYRFLLLVFWGIKKWIQILLQSSDLEVLFCEVTCFVNEYIKYILRKEI